MTLDKLGTTEIRHEGSCTTGTTQVGQALLVGCCQGMGVQRVAPRRNGTSNGKGLSGMVRRQFSESLSLSTHGPGVD